MMDVLKLFKFKKKIKNIYLKYDGYFKFFFQIKKNLRIFYV